MGTFLNAVKNLINSLTAKTSSTASTADMVQLHDANGNPNGKISLADLASVLGGCTYGGQWGTKDLNTAPDNSIVNASPVSTGSANYPSGAQRGFTMTRTIGVVKWQEFYELGGNLNRQIIAVHYRNCVSGTWYDWLKVTLT